MAKRTKVLEIGGKEYTLQYGANICADLEEKLGNPDIPTLLESSVSFRMMRSVFHAGLRTHHPEISLEEAGELIDEFPNGLADLAKDVFREYVAYMCPQLDLEKLDQMLDDPEKAKEELEKNLSGVAG